MRTYKLFKSDCLVVLALLPDADKMNKSDGQWYLSFEGSVVGDMSDAGELDTGLLLPAWMVQGVFYDRAEQGVVLIGDMGPLFGYAGPYARDVYRVLHKCFLNYWEDGQMFFPPAGAAYIRDV